MLGMKFRVLHMVGRCPTTELHLQQHACDVTVMVFPLHEKGLQRLMELRLVSSPLVSTPQC